MAVPLSLKDGVVVWTDSDGANSLTLDLEDGDLGFNIPVPHEHALDRGAPGVIVDGPFEPIGFSLSLMVKAISGTVEPMDVVLGTATGWSFVKVNVSTGSYSGKTASLQDVSAAVGVFQMKVTYTNPSTSAVENLYFLDCVATPDFSEGPVNKISITGICYLTRAAFMANID